MCRQSKQDRQRSNTNAQAARKMLALGGATRENVGGLKRHKCAVSAQSLALRSEQ